MRTLIGERRGLWTILERLPDKNGRRQYLCQCDCGTVKAVWGSSLYGNSKSCGCRNKVVMSEIRLNSIYNHYKSSANRRKIDFNLSKDEFEKLIDQSCYYCGESQTSKQSKNGQSEIRFTYTGIDRINSSNGYTIDNCVPCCKTCNMAKNSMTQEEFYSWVRRVYEHISTKTKAPSSCPS